MMRGDPGSPESQMSYRTARRAFIAACEKAHAETVARLHPAKGPDGKPLFMDSATLGPRRAARAALVIAYDAPGSEILIGLLGSALPQHAKLVLVHALDPAAFAGAQGDPAWTAAMLGAVATEDLSHVRHLAVAPLGRNDETLAPILAAHLPNAAITVLPQIAAQNPGGIAAFLETN
jgi:hypothetical protein